MLACKREVLLRAPHGMRKEAARSDAISEDRGELRKLRSSGAIRDISWGQKGLLTPTS